MQRSRKSIIVAVALLGMGLAPREPASAASAEAVCLKLSGDAGATCLRQYATTIEKCRRSADTACEDAARAEGGRLEAHLLRTERPISRGCTEESGFALGYPSFDDLSFRVPEACTDFAEDLLDEGFADDLSLLSPGELKCQTHVARRLRRLRKTIVKQFGRKCIVPEFTGTGCDRDARDQKIDKLRDRVRDSISDRCGDDFDALGLSTLDPGSSTLEDRVDDLLDRVSDRTRHYAIRVYPPNNLGPTAEFGPFPVGLKTLELEDTSRLNVPGDGPRPVVTEVYYPSTEAAVAGVPREVAEVLGLPVIEVPAYRDVDLAAGSYPLVVFSHGNNGIRIQSFFFGAHLASHGYIVVSPDHHGNTFVDGLAGIIDVASAINRPLDMSFLIDSFLAFDGEPGNFFEGAIDGSRIGASGHSFGGYTTLALAGGDFGFGPFTDPRIIAIFPQAPAASLFGPSFFNTITIPTLIVGGSIDETTPFASDQQYPFDNLPSGATVVGVAQIIGAGHFSFSDFCEVPRTLLAFLGGFDEACEPRHLPWRHSQDITKYLALNFFDATLNGDADALARLSPATLAGFENLGYQNK